MNPCTTITICRACGNPFTEDRPQSMSGRPICIPCVVGIDLPVTSGVACGALGVAHTAQNEKRAVGNNLPDAAAGESTRDASTLRRDVAAPALIHWPPAALPKAQPIVQAPFPYGRWTLLSRMSNSPKDGANYHET